MYSNTLDLSLVMMIVVGRGKGSASLSKGRLGIVTPALFAIKHQNHLSGLHKEQFYPSLCSCPIPQEYSTLKLGKCNCQESL